MKMKRERYSTDGRDLRMMMMMMMMMIVMMILMK